MPDNFNILAILQMITLLVIPALIFCSPLFLTVYLYRRRAFYFFPVTVGLGALTYLYLLNEFNPDAQGALIILFGPILTLPPVAITTISMVILDRFILKERSSE